MGALRVCVCVYICLYMVMYIYMLIMLALAGKGSGVLLCSLSVFWVIAGVLLTSRCLGGVCVGMYECVDVWQPRTRW